MWDEEQVEAAIDEAARQMTAGEPGADFRVRVMARIEAGSGLGVRVSVFRTWRPAAGLSVAALMLLTIVVLREPRSIEGPERQLNPVANSVAAPLPRPSDTPEVRLKPDATHELKPDATRELKPDATYGGDVDAVALPPIDLEPIAVAALPAGESISVEPLQAAAPIAVAPLSPEIEGDQR